MAIALQVGWHASNTGSQPSHSSDRKRPWSEDSDKMLQLMMGQFEARSTETLDLLGGSSAALMLLELETEKPLPCGWEKCLDLKTGSVYYMNSSSGTKTLEDPRDSSETFPMRQSCSEATKSGIPPRDMKNISMGCDVFPPLHAMEKAPEEVLSPLVGKLKAGTQSAGVLHRAKLMETFGRNMKRDASAPASPTEEGIADSALELRLNLATSLTAAAKEEKPGPGKTLAGYSRDWLAWRMAEKVILSTPSGSQSGVDMGTTSSAHSFLSLQQTREDTSAVQSEAAGCCEAESKKSTGGEEQGMAIVGCPGCLMYVMLSKTEPRCPKCGSSVLVDFPSFNSSSPKKARLV